MSTANRVARFLAVGLAGFVVDAGLLSGLIGTGLDPFSARVISIAAAMFVTWRLNRALTFGASERGQAAEGLRYGLVAIAVAAFNHGLYSTAILVAGLSPLAAMAAATALATTASFFGYSRLVFAGRAPGQ